MNESTNQSHRLRWFQFSLATALVLMTACGVMSAWARAYLQTLEAQWAALAEIDAMQPRHSQHQPGQEVPEDHWAYRFAKKHWFFGFGAYT